MQAYTAIGRHAHDTHPSATRKRGRGSSPLRRHALARSGQIFRKPARRRRGRRSPTAGFLPHHRWRRAVDRGLPVRCRSATCSFDLSPLLFRLQPYAMRLQAGVATCLFSWRNALRPRYLPSACWQLPVKQQCRLASAAPQDRESLQNCRPSPTDIPDAAEPALADVSFIASRRGAFIAIVGPSGAGKSDTRRSSSCGYSNRVDGAITLDRNADWQDRSPSLASARDPDGTRTARAFVWERIADNLLPGPCRFFSQHGYGRQHLRPRVL